MRFFLLSVLAGLFILPCSSKPKQSISKDGYNELPDNADTISCSGESKVIYLYSYFQNNGEDGLHLAYSYDGLAWRAINSNKPLLKPEVGDEKLMRDPCIIKGGDGLFHIVWTVSWNEQGIGYANSPDLIHWSEQKYIPVMHHESNARNCWAPELFYDEEKEQYLIYWSTTIAGAFPETEKTAESGYNHRIYYCTTKDFNEFSKTQLLYDKGFNVIDATINKTDSLYIMFVKDETRFPEPQKNIRIATSTNIYGEYSEASGPITENWVEGPTAVQTDKGWIVYYDMYTRGRMGAVISQDLKNWTDITSDIDFPDNTRHGSVFKASIQILNNLINTN